MARKKKSNKLMGFLAYPKLAPGHGAQHSETVGKPQCNHADCKERLSQHHFQNPVERMEAFYNG